MHGDRRPTRFRFHGYSFLLILAQHNVNHLAIERHQYGFQRKRFFPNYRTLERADCICVTGVAPKLLFFGKEIQVKYCTAEDHESATERDTSNQIRFTAKRNNYKK